MKFFEKLFFKKRALFYATKDLEKQTFSENYACNIVDNVESLSQYKCLANNSSVVRRLEKECWILFVVEEIKTKEIAAYYWAIYSLRSNCWHDNFVISPGNALLCNAFVEKQHRKKGLYKFLIYQTHSFLFNNNIKTVFTIVERSNYGSLKANTSSGLSVCCNNCLIKVIGFNLFSVFTKNSKILMILFGSKLLKSVVYKKENLCQNTQ